MGNEHEPNDVCSFRRHEYLAREGEMQDRIYRLEEGWACSYRLLSDGRRQIVSLFLPGDFCEPQWVLSQRVVHPVIALTQLSAQAIPVQEIDRGRAAEAEGLKSIFNAMLQALNRQAEWIVSLGCKTATERVCSLICDIFTRMRANDLVAGNGCAMPLTQYDLADTVGLTPVHLNRVLKTLRARGLIELKSRSLRVPDLDALKRIAAA